MRGVGRVVAAQILFFIAVATLGGCGVVGPTSIKLGRNSYNEVIHQTSADQLLVNLVRIHNHEMPLFIDVTEVDATVQVQANASGAQTNIGARAGTTGGTLAGAVESVALSGQYLEAPTIRYQPLQGAPLIAQFNSPISVDSIVSMFNSDWPFDTLLPLTVDRLTAGFSDYYTALNAIVALDHNNALIIEAVPSGQAAGGGGGQKDSKATTAGPNNALALYFAPKGLANDSFPCETDGRYTYTSLNVQKVSVNLWLRLLRIYRPGSAAVTDAQVNSASSAELQGLIAGLPSSIEIPAASLRRPNHTRAAPLLHTRSALGVMKNLVEGEYSLAKFVSPDEAAGIINRTSTHPECHLPEHYYLVRDEKYDERIYNGTEQGITSSFRRNADTVAESVLYNSRKYMLIQVSSTPPGSAFVSAYEQGQYYFIGNDDKISKRTLALLALITSVQAIPAQTGGLTPALSVGAH